MTVELTRVPSKNEFPKIDKCCFFFNLRLSLTIWLVIESIFWSFCFISALYHEIIYIDEVDVLEFSQETENWYFYLIFGERSYMEQNMDQKIRSELKMGGKFINDVKHAWFLFFIAYIILINFLLMMIFLTYLAFCCLLIFGINAVNLNFYWIFITFELFALIFFPQFKKQFFIPYFVLDAVFVTLAFIGCLAGFIANITHLFRISFIFLVVKVYVELGVTSFYRDYKNKVKTFDTDETKTPGSPVSEPEDQPAPV